MHRLIEIVHILSMKQTNYYEIILIFLIEIELKYETKLY